MKAFDKLSPAEKRVVIAKDALKHLRAKRIRPHRGFVLDIPGHFLGEFEGQSLQKVLKKMKQPCEVCERGGLLFAYVWRKNDFTIPLSCSPSIRGVVAKTGGGVNGRAQDKLEEIFDRQQLAMMERSFEGDYNGGILDTETADKCIAFYFSHDTHAKRFKAILNNIIKNQGTFVLPS